MSYKFTTDNFEAEVLQSEIPVLVDFYADWCGPCKMMGPVVDKLAEEYAGRIKVGKCNVDESMQIAQKYGVASIPTFIVFDGGAAKTVFKGSMSAADMKAKVEQALN